MEYVEFLKKVKEQVKQIMGDGYEVTIESILKNNSLVLDGLIIKEPKQSRISPNIYLNSFYELYNEGVSIQEISQQITKVYYENNQVEQRYLEYVDMLNDYERCKDKIILRLHNKSLNEKLLEECPYEEFNDLAITYHYLVECGNVNIATIRINHSIFEGWNVDREELLKNAMSNTVRLFQPKVCYIRDMIRNLIDTQEYVFDDDFAEDEMDLNMLVITNLQCNFGAIAILYNGLLKCIADKLESDLIILPSSVHEVICVKKTDNTDIYDLLSMVKEVNDTQVKLEEILGYNIYIYSRLKETIEVVSKD